MPKDQYIMLLKKFWFIFS